MTPDELFCLGFSVFPGIGPVRFRALLAHCGDIEKAWNADALTLEEAGIPNAFAKSFLQFRLTFDRTAYAERLKRAGIVYIPSEHALYPRLLREISDAPIGLFVKGSLTRLSDTILVGVVGTRHMTQYGAQMCQEISSDLATVGCTVVSGLAYGIDAVAHKSTLEKHGKTIAVLGCGVDVIAPQSNTALYHDVLSHDGAIISEMPLGLKPSKGVFPARNRIISGVSQAIVVVEGDEKSGALITARYAAEQGREVCAVPGPATSLYSRGPHALLRSGAHLVTTAGDVLSVIGVERDTTFGASVESVDPQFQYIVTAFEGETVHVDELIRRVGKPAAEVAATLTMLELMGVVIDSGDKTYRLAKL